MALWIYALIIATCFFRSSSFLLLLSYPVPYRFFLLFSFGFTLGWPRTLTLHLTFRLAVHVLYHYTTVICWHFPGDKLLLCLATNQHYKNSTKFTFELLTSPFRLTARKNDLFLSIHWFSVEQKGHAFHSSPRSSLRRHLPRNEGLLCCSGRAQW